MNRRLTIEEIVAFLKQRNPLSGLPDAAKDYCSPLEYESWVRQYARLFAVGSPRYPDGFGSIEELETEVNRSEKRQEDILDAWLYHPEKLSEYGVTPADVLDMLDEQREAALKILHRKMGLYSDN